MITGNKTGRTREELNAHLTAVKEELENADKEISICKKLDFWEGQKAYFQKEISETEAELASLPEEAWVPKSGESFLQINTDGNIRFREGYYSGDWLTDSINFGNYFKTDQRIEAESVRDALKILFPLLKDDRYRDIFLAVSEKLSEHNSLRPIKFTVDIEFR